MATTVTFKLNKAAKEFAAGDSTAFNIQGGVRYYDRETKSDQWTNYSAVIFAKAPAQVQFYQNVLVEGAVIEVSGDKQKIRQHQGQNGLSLSIELLDAKLGFAFSPNQQPSQQPRQAQPAQQPQQGYQQPQQRQAPPQGYQGQMPQQNQQRQQGQSNSQGFHSNGQQFGNDSPIDFDAGIPF